MENFRFLLFGIAGVSVIFWVAVIALWHTYMFPKFFNEDKGLNSVINQEVNISTEPMKNLVVADFSTSNNFTLNKLYTTVMIGVTFASFIFITYGLSSSITTNS